MNPNTIVVVRNKYALERIGSDDLHNIKVYVLTAANGELLCTTITTKEVYFETDCGGILVGNAITSVIFKAGDSALSLPVSIASFAMLHSCDCADTLYGAFMSDDSELVIPGLVLVVDNNAQLLKFEIRDTRSDWCGT